MEDSLKTKDELLREIRELRLLRAETEVAQMACLLAEDAVRESEAKFRSVAHSAVDAIISIDSNDRVVFWNQAAQRIFGYTEDEALGQSVTFIIPEPSRNNIGRRFNRCVNASTSADRQYGPVGRPAQRRSKVPHGAVSGHLGDSRRHILHGDHS